jgi:hypothetical protein
MLGAFTSGLHRDEATPQWVTFGHYTNERLLRTSAGSTKPSCELPYSICISPQGIAQPWTASDEHYVLGRISGTSKLSVLADTLRLPAIRLI